MCIQETSLKLRAMEPEDVDFVLECESDPESARWSDYRAPFSRNQLLTYALTYDADPFRSEQIRLIVSNLDSLQIGIVDLYEISEKDSRAFIGITLHPSQRQKGLALPVIEAVLDYAIHYMGLRTLAAKVSTENSIALHIFEKAGFRKIALLPSWHRLGRDFHDFHLLIHSEI